MSSKKEETQAAADRIKAQTLTAAKGLSRTQAERAAAAAVRNVNAYGQKEEGPSRWQEKREAKRQMYLMSTEKAVKLGERKDSKHTMSTISGTPSQCQKCFQTGHWTYECKNETVYIARPSRTQQLKNPKLMMRMSVSYELDNPDSKKEVKDKKISKKSKRKYRSDSDSASDSEGSVFETDSGSSSVQSGYSSEGSSSDSDTEEEKKRRRKTKKHTKKKKKRRSPSYSSSSGSSDSASASDSDSDSDDKTSRKKSRRRSKKR